MNAIIATSIYALMSYIINFIFIEILTFFNRDLSFGLSLAIMTIVICIANSCVVIILGNIFKSNDFTNAKRIYFTIRKKDILNVLLIMLGFVLIRQSILYEFLNRFKGPITKENIEIICNNLNPIQLSITLFILMIQMIIISPILEELLFRGIIFNGILNKYRGCYKKAIVYSSIVFGVAHLNIPQGINAIIAGIILSSIYYFTKSIKLSIFAHFLNNFLIFMPSCDTPFMKTIYVLIGAYFLYKGIRLFKENTIFIYQES